MALHLLGSGQVLPVSKKIHVDSRTLVDPSGFFQVFVFSLFKSSIQAEYPLIKKCLGLAGESHVTGDRQ